MDVHLVFFMGSYLLLIAITDALFEQLIGDSLCSKVAFLIAILSVHTISELGALFLDPCYCMLNKAKVIFRTRPFLYTTD